MRFSSLLMLVMLLTLAGCERHEQKPIAQPEIKQDQAALENANNKIRELEAQLDQLRSENRRLRDKNGLLESQNENIKPRIQSLIAGYGTGIWDYDEDDNYLVFVKPMKGAGFRDVMTELNGRFKKYKQPRVQYKKKEDGTVFVGVDSEEQLGERMGSNGALGYMAIVAYSLTSVKGIDCVYFDIGESEHAGPGKYCKDGLEPLTPK